MPTYIAVAAVLIYYIMGLPIQLYNIRRVQLCCIRLRPASTVAAAVRRRVPATHVPFTVPATAAAPQSEIF